MLPGKLRIALLLAKQYNETVSPSRIYVECEEVNSDGSVEVKFTYCNNRHRYRYEIDEDRNINDERILLGWL